MNSKASSTGSEMGVPPTSNRQGALVLSDSSDYTQLKKVVDLSSSSQNGIFQWQLLYEVTPIAIGSLEQEDEDGPAHTNLAHEDNDEIDEPDFEDM